jgi:hypothetical protein
MALWVPLMYRSCEHKARRALNSEPDNLATIEAVSVFIPHRAGMKTSATFVEIVVNARRAKDKNKVLSE